MDDKDKVLNFKDFERIDGEVICIKNGRPKKPSKNKKQVIEIDQEFDIEEELINLVEENELLIYTLEKERIKSKTLEKVLNRLLKERNKDE